MCTSIAFSNEKIMLKNLDVPYSKGTFIFNKKGFVKKAFIFPPAKPVEWTSLYDNLTVNQHSKEFPLGGMNEKGLIVEQLTLPETEYRINNDLPSCQDLQWIQMMLDTCESTEEVLKKNEEVSINQSSSRLHFIIMDSFGDIGVIEFIEGEICIYRISYTHVSLFNHSFKSNAKDPNNDYLTNSLHREKLVEKYVKAHESKLLQLENYFEILQSAERPDTVLSLLYDNKNMVVYFKYQEKIQKITWNQLSSFSENKMMGFNASEWKNYCKVENRRLAQNFFEDEFLKEAFKWEITDEMLDFYAEYPESFEKNNIESST